MDCFERFKNYYIEEKGNIDKEIIKYNQETEKYESNPLLLDNVKLICNLNLDGKRIRGVLANLGYYLLKDDKEVARDLSLAYEIFQTSVLVHDDVIDNDDTRRGKDTIHFANRKKYSEYSDNKEEVDHLSKSIAICMGDYGLFLAVQIICNAYNNDPKLPRILKTFIETVLTTVKGELIDVILPFQGKHNLLDNKQIEENILEIYRLKTAHYTVIGPLWVGMLLAGADESFLKDIEVFGEKVGIAFQIQDDILGIFSNDMGKIKGSDIREFKQTILYSHILDTDYKDEFLKYYGNGDISEDTIHKVQDLLINSGSYDYAINYMNKLYDEGISLIDNWNWLTDDKKELLHGFVEFLRQRDV